MITLTSTRRRQVAAAAAFAFALSAAASGRPAAQGTKSGSAAKSLVEALEAAKLDAIAAPDPTDPSTFVAALYIQGAQLMVVSAKYAAPPLLVEKIKAKNYRDVYIDLNSASVAGSKVFCIDINLDGLVAKPDDNQGADTWEHGTTQVSFDGDWKKAKLTEEAYMKAYSAADERYAQLLSLLIAQAKQG
jgi:hypothetical protein